MDLIRDDVKVSWLGIHGRGQFLEFQISIKLIGEWFEIESHCTRMPRDTSVDILEKALEYIMGEIYDKVHGMTREEKEYAALGWYSSLSNKADDLAYIGPDWFEDTHYVEPVKKKVQVSSSQPTSLFELTLTGS